MNVKLINILLSLIATLVSVASFAQAPDGSTGMCKDGTYTTASTKKGACAGHKGVKEWFANDVAPVVAEKTSPTTSPAIQANSTIKKEPVKKIAAPGGGSGQVWVNTDSKVYHCEGDRYYGKTKQGEYMSEAAAKASGARPDHGKACS